MTTRGLFFLLTIGASSGCGDARYSSQTRDTTRADDSQRTGVVDKPWHTRKLSVAPERFRPGGWSDENTLWGLVRGRVTRLDVRTGAARTLSATAWSVQAAPGVASWHTEDGVWLLRGGGSPLRLATYGNIAPTSVLWSRDGKRALLTWEDEGRARHELLEADGSSRVIDLVLPGYFSDRAALWLDSVRVLFQIVASGPVRGEATYKESGWRGDLAVLDLRSGAYTRVTDVPDLSYLRVAGPYLDQVLVTEWHATGVRAQWLYDSRNWEHVQMLLPAGRAFASVAGAVVVLLDPGGDSTTAMLIAGGDSTVIGTVARDAEPVFSPSGRVGSLRTSRGVMFFERAP